MHQLTNFNLLISEGVNQRIQKFIKKYQKIIKILALISLKQFIKCYKNGDFPAIFDNILTVYRKYIRNAREQGGGGEGAYPQCGVAPP